MKVKLLKIINPILFLAFCVQAVTGFFPMMLNGLGYSIHPYSAWVILSCLALHLYLNWGWIRSNIFGFVFSR